MARFSHERWHSPFAWKDSEPECRDYPDTSVTLAYTEVDHSVLSVVEQIAGDQEKALTFLRASALLSPFVHRCLSKDSLSGTG
jgi:hypothetical protein